MTSRKAAILTAVLTAVAVVIAQLCTRIVIYLPLCSQILGSTLPGPAALQVLPHEATYLAGLPSAPMYERSFMHRDVLTCVAVAATNDFLLTGSADGHLKFWKKRPGGVEFVKHFRAHKGPVDGAQQAGSLTAAFCRAMPSQPFGCSCPGVLLTALCLKPQ